MRSHSALELHRAGRPEAAEHGDHRVPEMLVARPDARDPLVGLGRDAAERRRALGPRQRVVQGRQRRANVGLLVAGRPRHERLDPRIIQWTPTHRH